MRIGINCGHTKSGAGCGAVGFINESDETRKVGNALIKLLKQGGHTVVDCTNDKASSTSENLRKIVQLANAQTLDLFVSIHFNAGKGQGSEVFTYNGKKHTEAVNICKALEKLGFRNRGVKGSNLYVINHTKAKALLIEVCFVDTKSDVDLYKKLGTTAIAKAIYTAITGKAVTETKPSTNKGGDKVVYNYVDKNMPEWARATIQKLVDKKYLTGNEKGELQLKEDMLRIFVTLDRAGNFN